MREVRCAPPRRRAVQALTVEQARDLLVLLGTGMRIGEALALRWTDIDPGSRLRLTHQAGYE